MAHAIGSSEQNSRKPAYKENQRETDGRPIQERRHSTACPPIQDRTGCPGPRRLPVSWQSVRRFSRCPLAFPWRLASERWATGRPERIRARSPTRPSRRQLAGSEATDDTDAADSEPGPIREPASTPTELPARARNGLRRSPLQLGGSTNTTPTTAPAPGPILWAYPTLCRPTMARAEPERTPTPSFLATLTERRPSSSRIPLPGYPDLPACCPGQRASGQEGPLRSSPRLPTHAPSEGRRRASLPSCPSCGRRSPG